MNHVTIIATSLSESSKSQLLASFFEAHLKSEGINVELVDLRKMKLNFAGSENSWSSSDANLLEAAVRRASHIVFAVPIYCYDVNSSAKNVIELIGKAFTKKVIGFICTAGGANSYMSVLGFANHLMLDFRSVIVPRFVYVDRSGWNGDVLVPAIEARLKQLVSDMDEVQVISKS